MFKDFNTGEVYTIEELQQAYEQFKDEMVDDDGNYRYADFDEYMDQMLLLGREKIGGYIEV